MSIEHLYGMDSINVNDISDDVANILRKIIGVKRYLDDTKKIERDSTCIISIAIVLLKSHAPFPYQIENFKKYVIDNLQVDYIKLLDKLFNISPIQTVKVMNNIFNEENTIQKYIDNRNNKLINKISDLIEKNNKNKDKDYTYKNYSKDEVFKIFKNNFRQYITLLDDGTVPIKLKDKNLETSDKKIIHFLIRIALESWNNILNNNKSKIKAIKFMLALENKKLKNNCKKFDINSYEYINYSKKLKDNNINIELETEKLMDCIYFNEKYINPKQICDKKAKERAANKHNIFGPNEKIKKSIKNGGITEIIYEEHNEEEKRKYIWFLNVLIDEDNTLEKIKFCEVIKFNQFIIDTDPDDYNITSNNCFLRESTYREKKAIVDMIFDKYYNNDKIMLLLILMKKDDPYLEIDKYIRQKIREINEKFIEEQKTSFNDENHINVLRKIF